MRSELQCKVGERLNTYLATVDHCDWPDNPTPKAARSSRIDWLCSANRASVWVTGGTRRRVDQEDPPVRIYIIGNDGITLCREGASHSH